jgi:hypothetical protein
MRHLAFLALALVPLAGCSIDLGSSTDGEKGRAQFSYSGTCFLGCAVDHPVMSGGVARITISGKDLPEVNAQSSNTAVLTVTTEHTYSCCTSTSDSVSCSAAKKGDTCPSGATMNIGQSMTVTGHRAGFSRVLLIDGASKEIDAIQLEVADAANVTLKNGDARLDKIDLTVGLGVTFTAEIRDAGGRELEGSVRYVTSNPKIASFDDPSWFFADPNGVASIDRTTWLTSTTLRGRSAGATTMQIAAGKFTKSFAVTVKSP